MIEQFKLLKDCKLPAEKKIKKLRLPDVRGYDIFEGYAERFIGKTIKEHKCRICKTIIPAGSRAKEIIQVANGKLMVQAKEYAHIRGKCPPIAEQ